jgi:hypothetical protein
MLEQVDISLVERQRSAIEFCVRLGNSGSETLQLIHEPMQSTSRPMQFQGSSNHENGAPRQEISKWSRGQNRLFHYPPEACTQTLCSTFPRNGWSVVRSASLARGGTSKKRPSPHLHEVPTQSNKVSSRTFQTALVKLEISLINFWRLHFLHRHNVRPKTFQCSNVACVAFLPRLSVISISCPNFFYI